MSFFVVGNGPLGQEVHNACPCRRKTGSVAAGRRSSDLRSAYGPIVRCYACELELLELEDRVRLLGDQLGLLRRVNLLVSAWRQRDHDP